MSKVRVDCRTGGFTIIEMMITLVIASILMSIVAPGMAGLVERNRLQATSESLFSSLMLTRSEALKRNRGVTMCKSVNGTACATASGTQWEQGWLVYVDVNGNATPDADEILRVSGALADGMTLRSAGDFVNEVSYNTDGTASGSGTFVMCNPSGDTASAREVAVAFTGRPKMNKTTSDCTPS